MSKKEQRFKRKKFKNIVGIQKFVYYVQRILKNKKTVSGVQKQGRKEDAEFFPRFRKRTIEVQNKIIEEFNVSRKYPRFYKKIVFSCI